MKPTLFLPLMALLIGGLWFTGSESGQASLSTPTPAPALQRERPLTISGNSTATSKPTSRNTAPTSRPVARPSVKDCATGCAAVKSKEPPLKQEAFHSLMQAFAAEPLRDGAKALETLLFHGHKTLGYLDTQVLPPIAKGHLDFLKRELKRDHMELSFRIKDEKGVIRAAFKKRVKIGKHFHYEAEEYRGLQRPAFGGKSKRVGLHHIWVRI